MKSLSKSAAKSLNCEYYYRKYIIERLPQHPMPWTRTGSDFHGFMDQYVQFLVAAKAQFDLSYMAKWLESNPVTDDALALMMRYVPKFALADPSAVIGVESFLVIDRELRAVPGVPYPGLGRSPVGEDYMAHGTLDRVERTGEFSVDVTDYKTGFLPQRVDEYEAKHYALLALAHFPWCEEVRFIWDFVRFGYREEVVYTRGQWEDLVLALHQKLAKRALVELTPEERVAVNPMGGVCGYCDLACPIREPIIGGDRIFFPIQTNDDAIRAAGALVAIRSARATLEAQLKAYLAKAGAVDMGGDKQAALVTMFTPVLKLRTVLASLGVETPEMSPGYDVPLDSLVINGSEFKSFASAKKRAGLRELVEASVPTKPRTELRIGDAETVGEL